MGGAGKTPILFETSSYKYYSIFIWEIRKGLIYIDFTI